MAADGFPTAQTLKILAIFGVVRQLHRDDGTMPTARVLVVASNPQMGETVVGWLTSAGHDTRLLSDFASAKPEIDADPPALLVAEVKLGAFNGLHLAIRARGRNRNTPSIVIGDPDRVLEAEARRQHVRYLTQPLEEATFSETARQMFEQRPGLPVDAVS